MTKDELVNWMAKEAGITKKAAAAALDAFVKAIHDSLKKKTGKIRIADLGTFIVPIERLVLGLILRPRKRLRSPQGMFPALEHPSRSSRRCTKQNDESLSRRL